FAITSGECGAAGSRSTGRISSTPVKRPLPCASSSLRLKVPTSIPAQGRERMPALMSVRRVVGVELVPGSAHGRNPNRCRAPGIREEAGAGEPIDRRIDQLGRARAQELRELAGLRAAEENVIAVNREARVGRV